MKNTSAIKVEGIVEEALPGLLFRVTLRTKEGQKQILAHLGGKMKIHKIRIVAGDTVAVEMSNINDIRGRIIRRF
ncbi:translation initiation factor IF-1 [Candidatus Jorgensenbacteria bacterium RIFCSPLOWO2_01_FULL_45_25b]|uniref:Translation initiation factor IF-1 n=1 Tax=Candidatus Jorgensenbacteria bacterium RIFCSPLOWO2_01_FULL_45_25b TaxID=1798471 RepID=A0A1F6BT01_9BACT|nr:MAG: translation initiation factor IF-1 [Candidatus Jorgensenbacteria bacterium RIFCSPLOWO2_01_FULL_45_25b]